jgi:hypothetical protein
MRYLHLCRPLMRIFTARDRDACYATLGEFENERADSLMKTESLALLTMSGQLLERMLDRADLDSPEALSLHEKRHKMFLEHLASNQFDEIITLPDIDAIKSGSVKVSLSDQLGGGAVYYTREEFAAHLEQVIKLLETYENYHVHLLEHPGEDRYMVYAREDHGVIVAKTSQPPVVLAISESNMTAAFWDYLKSMSGDRMYTASDRTAAAADLWIYLSMLKDD